MQKVVSISKSLVIVALAVLAVYMSARLWFVEFTNHSFMPYVQARFAPTVPDDASELVRPFRVIAGAGDGYFGVLYGATAGAAFWEYGQRVITDLLRNGHFVQTHDANVQQILSYPVIVYEYAFFMDIEVFTQAFGRRASSLLAERGVDSFHAVAVKPPYGQRNTVNVFFIGDNSIAEFALLPNDREFSVYIPSASNLRRYFIQDGNGLSFAMQLHRNFTYNPILPVNPYVNRAGFLHLSFIREQIEHFFDNPATINQGLSVDDVYTFSNLRTVVRYQPWDVVEYSSFRTIGRTSPTSFISDFSAAFDFVRRDPNVNNEFFLSGYELRGRETVFWFGYVINNFPLVLSEPWYTGPGCTVPLIHPIEVVVDHGRVISYRKIAYNFIVDTTITARPALAFLSERALTFHIQPANTHDHLRLQPVREGGSE